MISAAQDSDAMVKRVDVFLSSDLAAFKYAYKQSQAQSNWFMKTTDDIYIVVENMGRFLAEYDSNIAHAFVFVQKHNLSFNDVTISRMLILSKAAVSKLFQAHEKPSAAEEYLVKNRSHGLGKSCLQPENDKRISLTECFDQLSIKTTHLVNVLDIDKPVQKCRHFPEPVTAIATEHGQAMNRSMKQVIHIT